MVTPFVLLLLAMAFMPLIHRHHWEKHYPKISLGLGLVTLVYYLVALRDGGRVLDSLVAYVGFMALIGSLFVITGGIHIRMTGEATPLVNTGLLALGALLANLIGTTGASVLLIRPFLQANRRRAAAYHVVFFIFIVSNAGGALTPIGDPPLFLGYLKGVPFFWLLGNAAVLFSWVLFMAVMLTLFFVWDWRNARRGGSAPAPPAGEHWSLQGRRGFIFLAIIIGLVLLQKAEFLKRFSGLSLFAATGQAVGWNAEQTEGNLVTMIIAVLMCAAAAAAYRLSRQEALQKNEFDWGPLREVGILFAGIFVTMTPALELLEKHAASLGLATARHFYWGTGLVSSVLDNAPTYLSFLATAAGLHHVSLENAEQVRALAMDPAGGRLLVAISLGAVFFGAATYIGNGPNLMVKSMAESAGVKCPSFPGYVLRYALPILLPLLIAISLLIDALA